MSLMPPKNINYSDEFMTPDYAVSPLLQYLDKDWVIWECAPGTGNIVAVLNSYEFKVDAHITDFFKDTVDSFDCIVTNPPYSLKNQFLERCYQLGKPFALLLPLTTLESKFRQNLFRKHGVEIILFDKRINFMCPDPEKKSSAWFATAWFTWGLNIGKELTFLELDRDNTKGLFDE